MSQKMDTKSIVPGGLKKVMHLVKKAEELWSVRKPIGQFKDVFYKLKYYWIGQ